MNQHTLPASLFLVGSLSLLLGCEREAVGETYAGQVKGGPVVELSWDSPPRGATAVAGAPAALPETQMHGTVPPGEPAILALLGGSGQTMRDNTPEVRLIPPPVEQPAEVAPPVDGTAAAIDQNANNAAIEMNTQIDPAHRAVIVNSPPPPPAH